MDRTELARKALKGALEVRQRAEISADIPVCAYDLAEKIGVEVKFVAVKSLEGMYSKTSQTILLSCLRPPGRKNQTCCHEIGHWYFKHGNCIDQVNDIANSADDTPQERLANAFAAFLLMPPWAIREAISRRGYSMSALTPLQLYNLSCQFNAGYSSLAKHMHWGLALLTHKQHDFLLNYQPKHLRMELLGEDCPGGLVVSDKNWASVPIDLQVGDYAIIPEDIIVPGPSLQYAKQIKNGILVSASQPGITRLQTKAGDWSTYVRVCRKDFTGRSIYRHLEEAENE